MSLIPDALWHTAFPDLPKPAGCTYWQFAAMRDALWAEEDKDWTARYIQTLEEIKQIHHAKPQTIQDINDLITNELNRSHHG